MAIKLTRYYSGKNIWKLFLLWVADRLVSIENLANRYTVKINHYVHEEHFKKETEINFSLLRNIVFKIDQDAINGASFTFHETPDGKKYLNMSFSKETKENENNEA